MTQYISHFMAITCLLLVSYASGNIISAAEGNRAINSTDDPNPWPISYQLPESLFELWGSVDERALQQYRKSIQLDQQHVELWIPPESQRIRAILLIANNTDSYLIGEHPAVREVAGRQHMAIMHFKAVPGALIEHVPAEGPKVAARSMEIILNQAAELSGIDDLRHAAWITLGKSSREDSRSIWPGHSLRARRRHHFLPWASTHLAHGALVAGR